MYKLIAILVAVIPIILFLRTVFFGRSQVMRQASADLRRHVDYLVWAILFLIACGIVYSVVNLIHPLWK
jgi:ABC-type phosphate/phosphonate transport system permease subunit